MNIFISNSAFGDFEGIKEYYEKEGVPHTGKQFVSAIIDHIQALRENPDIGRAVPEFEEPGIRELVHSPFRVVYLRELNPVHVVKIWRSERKLVLPETET